MKLWIFAILLFSIILFVNGQEDVPEELIESNIDSDDLEGFEGVAATGAGKI